MLMGRDTLLSEGVRMSRIISRLPCGILRAYWYRFLYSIGCSVEFDLICWFWIRPEISAHFLLASLRVSALLALSASFSNFCLSLVTLTR